ncbi:MAG: DUF1836 domain-containing protein [Lachnospiraceae bacterium]|nr:DUF1836 domain-containing protein [Lachnospiraceae bacterium]
MTDSEKLLAEVISKLELIKEADIPSIDLYMDQVTTFMDTHLKCRKRFDDDKILTKTMINNYAKNELLPSPEKKRYSKQHIIMLIFIYYFKNILSINDIKTILGPISDKYFKDSKTISLEEIYNAVCDSVKEHLSDIRQDIQKSIDESKSTFTDVPEKDKDFLQLFSLIVSLSFDVYVKKQMIETIVDSLSSEQQSSPLHEKNKEKSKEKSREKSGDKEKNKNTK